MTEKNAREVEKAAVEFCAVRQLSFRKLLGRGAFKSAYLAVDDEGRPVAVKLALLAGSPERLIRETRALQDCSHPGISKVESAELFQSDGITFWVVVEEFLPGGTLEQRLGTQGKIVASKVAHLGALLGDVLLHLNERRLVHRDIKPANILFRNSGAPVLTDFGIVRMLDEPTLTRAFLPQGPGTPAYAAPEQLTNDKSLIDWRTDQFGLAVVLAECFLGHHPYQTPAIPIYEAISAVAARSPMPPENSQLLKMAGLQPLIKALSPWPIGRFRQPVQFVDALRSIGG